MEENKTNEFDFNEEAANTTVQAVPETNNETNTEFGVSNVSSDTMNEAMKERELRAKAKINDLKKANQKRDEYHRGIKSEISPDANNVPNFIQRMNDNLMDACPEMINQIKKEYEYGQYTGIKKIGKMLGVYNAAPLTDKEALNRVLNVYISESEKIVQKRYKFYENYNLKLKELRINERNIKKDHDEEFDHLESLMKEKDGIEEIINKNLTARNKHMDQKQKDPQNRHTYETLIQSESYTIANLEQNKYELEEMVDESTRRLEYASNKLDEIQNDKTEVTVHHSIGKKAYEDGKKILDELYKLKNNKKNNEGLLTFYENLGKDDKLSDEVSKMINIARQGLGDIITCRNKRKPLEHPPVYQNEAIRLNKEREEEQQKIYQRSKAMRYSGNYIPRNA